MAGRETVRGGSEARAGERQDDDDDSPGTELVARELALGYSSAGCGACREGLGGALAPRRIPVRRVLLPENGGRCTSCDPWGYVTARVLPSRPCVGEGHGVLDGCLHQHLVRYSYTPPLCTQLNERLGISRRTRDTEATEALMPVMWRTRCLLGGEGGWYVPGCERKRHDPYNKEAGWLCRKE